MGPAPRSTYTHITNNNAGGHADMALPLGSMPGNMASIVMSDRTLTLNTTSLASCSGASFIMTSKGDALESRVYDAATSGSPDCWPLSAAYALVIKTALVGRAQVR